MEDLDFKHLKRIWTLKLVVETGSIKKAAVRANVTSSAISQAVTGLEAHLGRKLLLRKKENVFPTEYGRQILNAAEPAFGVCTALQRSMMPACATAPKIDWLDFAASESVAGDVLPQLVKNLRLKIPGIRLKVKTGRSSVLTALVNKGELCMALVEENDEIQDASAIEVAQDRLGFFCATDVETRALGSKAFDQLGVGHIAAGSEGHPLYMTKFLKCLGRGFRPTLTSDSYDLLRTAAVAGTIVALLPTRIARSMGSQLMELPPPTNASAASHKGAYKIYLVSEPGCTIQENEFLAHELKSLIRG